MNPVEGAALFRRRPKDPQESLQNHGLDAISALLHGGGFALPNNPLLDVFRFTAEPWGSQEIGLRPRFRSDISPDQTPYELSVAFGPQGPREVRYVIEAQGVEPNLVSQRAAGRSLNRRLQEVYGVSLDKSEKVDDLFCPQDPEGPFSIYHGVVWRPGHPPEFKQYFNPLCAGPANAYDLLNEAMSKLGLQKAWQVAKESGHWREQDIPLVFALDLSAKKEARVKVYWMHPGATSAELEAKCKPFPTYREGDAALLCRTLTGQDGPFAAKPIFSHLSFVDGAPGPDAVDLYFPLTEYLPNDLVVRDRVAELFDRLGVPSPFYRRMIDAFANRPLESGLGMHNFVAFKRDASGEPRVTVYFCAEAYGVHPVISVDANSSRLPGFYRLSIDERIQAIGKFTGLSAGDLRPLRDPDGLPEKLAECMSENVIGRFSLPLAVATNFRVNGRDYVVPMAIEEPSVVAAASNAAKLLRGGAGIRAQSTDPIMIGQIHFPDPPPAPLLETLLDEHMQELGQKLNRLHPGLVAAGGGFRTARVRRLTDLEGKPLAVVHMHIDVRDAMGANAVNSMAEEAAEMLGRWTGKRIGLRILSNLPLHRRVWVEGMVGLKHGGGEGVLEPEDAHRIAEASRFAEADPYRAVTANKGIMNGIDAVLLATGQDFRAVEAAAHAFAAYEGRYRALAQWRVDGEVLVGSLELPLALGIVGGITSVHPVVRANLRILGVTDARTFAQVVAAVGLAQNLAATRALAVEGIQRGHMRLHARNIALAAGATPEEAPVVVESMVQRGTVSEVSARLSLDQIRGRQAATGQPSKK